MVFYQITDNFAQFVYSKSKGPPKAIFNPAEFELEKTLAKTLLSIVAAICFNIKVSLLISF